MESNKTNIRWFDEPYNGWGNYVTWFVWVEVFDQLRWAEEPSKWQLRGVLEDKLYAEMKPGEGGQFHWTLMIPTIDHIKWDEIIGATLEKIASYTFE